MQKQAALPRLLIFRSSLQYLVSERLHPEFLPWLERVRTWPRRIRWLHFQRSSWTDSVDSALGMH